MQNVPFPLGKFNTSCILKWKTVSYILYLDDAQKASSMCNVPKIFDIGKTWKI